MNRVRLNMRTDVVIGLLLLATAFSWRNHQAHLVLGAGLVVVVAAHLWLHRRWVAVQVRKVVRSGNARPSSRTRFDLLVDLSIGALFLLSAMSGLILVASNSTLWASLHSASSWAMFLGCAVHLVSHVGWIVRYLRVNPLPAA